MDPIYTKTGDDGTTGRLFGGRLSKDEPVVEAIGDVDETVAALALARALCTDPALNETILEVQRSLFVLSADLIANPRQRHRLVPKVSLVTAAMTDAIEVTMDRLAEEHPLRPVFIVPGANPVSAALDLARTVLRRAERHLVRLQRTGVDLGPDVPVYVNRLSDLLYLLARQAAGDDEEPVSHD